VREVGAGIVRDIPGIMHRLQQSPASNTLVHGDLRLDNMFFGDANMPFALIDWQILWRTTPGVDLAWFLGQSIEPELRRAHESELLAFYLSELAANGVESYDEEQLWSDYRLGLMYRFLAPVVLCSGGFEMGNERGTALATAQCRGDRRPPSRRPSLAWRAGWLASRWLVRFGAMPEHKRVLREKRSAEDAMPPGARLCRSVPWHDGERRDHPNRVHLIPPNRRARVGDVRAGAPASDPLRRRWRLGPDPDA
jgi:hypothetical protein